MKINIEVGDFTPFDQARVGNVYPVRGGRGAANGNMMVLLAITEPKESWHGPSALMLVIDKQGKPQGITSYGASRMDELQPIAFVEGLDALELTMRSL